MKIYSIVGLALHCSPLCETDRKELSVKKEPIDMKHWTNAQKNAKIQKEIFLK